MYVYIKSCSLVWSAGGTAPHAQYMPKEKYKIIRTNDETCVRCVINCVNARPIYTCHIIRTRFVHIIYCIIYCALMTKCVTAELVVIRSTSFFHTTHSVSTTIHFIFSHFFFFLFFTRTIF